MANIKSHLKEIPNLITYEMDNYYDKQGYLNHKYIKEILGKDKISHKLKNNEILNLKNLNNSMNYTQAQALESEYERVNSNISDFEENIIKSNKRFKQNRFNSNDNMNLTDSTKYFSKNLKENQNDSKFINDNLYNQNQPTIPVNHIIRSRNNINNIVNYKDNFSEEIQYYPSFESEKNILNNLTNLLNSSNNIKNNFNQSYNNLKDPNLTNLNDYYSINKNIKNKNDLNNEDYSNVIKQRNKDSRFSEIKVSNPFTKYNNHYLLKEKKLYKENQENLFQLSNSKNNLNNNNDNKEITKTYNCIQIDKIRHLPLEQQILILYNENKQLNNELNKYKNIYNKNNFEDENKKFKLLIEEYEKILLEFINFINNINEELNKDKININDIKENSQNLSNFFDSLKNEFLYNIKRNYKRKKKKINNLIPQNNFENSKEYLSDDNIYSNRLIEKLKKLNGKNILNNENYFLEYYNIKKKNCVPCKLGLNNSNKGYSPIMCSPNYKKYINIFNN